MATIDLMLAAKTDGFTPSFAILVMFRSIGKSPGVTWNNRVRNLRLGVRRREIGMRSQFLIVRVAGAQDGQGRGTVDLKG